MKRALSFLLSVVLLLCMLLSSASANSSGLPGGLLTVVEDNPDYKDYTNLTDNYSKNRQIAQFIMHARYHNQLFSVSKQDGKWTVDTISTVAVYQPNYTLMTPELSRTANGFTLTYEMISESYTFTLHVDDNGNLYYELTAADMEDVTLRKGDLGYIVTLGDDSAIWFEEVTLDNFNISEMPHRGPEDVRRMNSMRRGLGYMATLTASPNTQLCTGEKLAVYSAPQEDSYRAAKGKASVVMNKDVLVYDVIDDWALVEYNVQLRTNRFGWVYTGIKRDEATTNWMVRVPALTAESTSITDDPNVSQYSQALLSKGQPVTVLGYLNSGDNRNWAYVYAEAIVDDVLMRGFIPMRDLVWDDVLLEDKRADYAGAWRMDGGSEIYYEYMILTEDGLVYSSDKDGYQPLRGTWEIVQQAPDSNLWWLSSADTLVLHDDNGYERRFGIYAETDEDGNRTLSLLYGEGGCGYLSVLCEDRTILSDWDEEEGNG